jgi:lycopene beta-cyclase
VGTEPDLDVVVIGNGPAAYAVAASCTSRGLGVVRVGPVQAWAATYGAWSDEVGAHRSSLACESSIDVVATSRRRLDRAYGVFDNTRLRTSLDVVPVVEGRATAVRHHGWGAEVLVDTGDVLRTRIVVDATGAGSTSVIRSKSALMVPQQRAYGLVLDHRPLVIGGEASVLMDWRQPAGFSGSASFLYVLALSGDRWLVEETSLAAAPPMPLELLRARLAARLGADLTSSADQVESVSIPMASGLPSCFQSTIGFGASAGYVHPATGYSVAASLRAAPRVAAAIESALGEDDPRVRSALVWDAVWPADHRRARALHDYGLAALLRLPAAETAEFFEAFFGLPTELWSSYLRVDTDAETVRKVMRLVFTRVSWRSRRRLAMGNPLHLARSVPGLGRLAARPSLSLR